MDYVEQGTKKYEEQYETQMTKFLQKKAVEFGYAMVAITGSEGSLGPSLKLSNILRLPAGSYTLPKFT